MALDVGSGSSARTLAFVVKSPAVMTRSQSALPTRPKPGSARKVAFVRAVSPATRIRTEPPPNAFCIFTTVDENVVVFDMTTDKLIPTDCAALLGSLRRTLLPLHCAHGRPTAVLLAPGVARDASGTTAAAAVADAPAVAAFVDDDDHESTPAKRRRMLVRRAKKEWRAIRTMVEQATSE